MKGCQNAVKHFSIKLENVSYHVLYPYSSYCKKPNDDRKDTAKKACENSEFQLVFWWHGGGGGGIVFKLALPMI